MASLGYAGIDVADIYTSSYATALYLKERGFARDSGAAAAGKKVFCATADGLVQELKDLGIEAIGGVDYAAKLCGMSVADTAELPLEEDVGAVVTGFNINLNYALISLAARYAMQPGTLLLAANDDRTTPQGPNKTPLPAGGIVLAAVEHASSRKAEVIGKPNQFMLSYILEQHGEGVDRKDVLMVGDRLDTDVMFGARGGLKTMLVLSGCTSAEALAAHAERLAACSEAEAAAEALPPLPNFYGDSVTSLLPEGNGDLKGGASSSPSSQQQAKKMRTGEA